VPKLKLIIGLVVVSGAAIFCAIQHQAGLRLREENASLRQQLAKLTQLQADNERLSNLADQAQNPLTSKQFLELMALRGEVGRLRQQTNMLQRLREQNQQLRTTLASTIHPQYLSATNLAAKPPPLAVYPKASWAFAGYATPEAAFQSLNWAAAHGDLNAMLDGSTSNMQQEFAKDFGNKSESDSADFLKNHVNKNTEVSILKEDIRSDNEVVLVVLGDADDDNTPANLVFQKIDGRWKFASESEHIGP
jgi:hypothetical protein